MDKLKHTFLALVPGMNQLIVDAQREERLQYERKARLQRIRDCFADSGLPLDNISDEELEVSVKLMGVVIAGFGFSAEDVVGRLTSLLSPHLDKRPSE